MALVADVAAGDVTVVTDNMPSCRCVQTDRQTDDKSDERIYLISAVHYIHLVEMIKYASAFLR